MKPDVKIVFSEKELDALNDSAFFDLKSSITKKMYHLFHELKEELQKEIEQSSFKFPSETDIDAGKISRGENYKGLPFVILDFPRLFSTDEVLAFRSMVWWGKHISFTLHIKGMALDRKRKNLFDNIKLLKPNDLVCINNEEWEHHMESSNYKPISDFEENALKELISQHPFFKLCRSYELNNMEQIPQLGRSAYTDFLKVLEG